MKSYETILKNLRITETNNEEFIGERLSMENFFLRMIALETENYDLDIEEVVYNIDLMLDLIKELNDSGLDYKEIVKVGYNPMGCFTYEKYEEITDTEFIEKMKKMQKELNEKGE